MSSESETNEQKERNREKSKTTKSTKFAVRTVKYLRSNCTQGEIFSYIDGLHEHLKKSQKKLKKYKEKVKKLTKKISKLKIVNNVPTERKPTVPIKESKEDSNEDTEPKEPLSLVDEIREAAEAAQNETGFVYEPTSGLYYDQRTGYYYNAEYGLYYDGNTGCYYKYDQDNNKFDFHSQVEVQSSVADKACDIDNYVISNLLDNFSTLNIDQMRTNALDDYEFVENDSRKEATKRRPKKRKRQPKSERKEAGDAAAAVESKDREDGELNSSASDSPDSMEEFKENGHYQDIARKYPPSLRMIVQETNLDKLQVGTLRLITFKGGTLGREGDHDVVIPDVNVSKFHLKFTYDEEKEGYTCVDLGSRNGTFLNGKRMSASQQESDSLDLVHGSVLQLSQTKLLCHVHPGNSTCGQCEPGLLMETKEGSSKSVLLSHKQQLKKLQQRYGLENEKFLENRTATGYNDRAATRRVEVGSSTDKEKTEMASVDTAISSENKGFKMLAKLGWSKGEALGKSNTSGLLEPIAVNANEGTKGLGCEDVLPTVVVSKKNKQNMEKWRKAQERYNKVAQVNVFSSSDDDDVVS